LRLALAAILLASVSHVKASVSDEACLQYSVFREASGESVRGVAATLQTIKNRARKRGLTVCETIREHNQFSWYKRGKISTKLPTKFLQKYKIAATLPAVVEDCTEFFHHRRIKPWWARGKKGKRVGNQIYYC
jgi:spore germination cell wall hydrolase CwlJ-like protein